MGGKEITQQAAKKFFTLREAERQLPRVKRILARIITLNQALDLLSTIELEVYDDDYENLPKVTKLNKQFHKLSYEFYLNIEKLENIGCLLKDIEYGIIDFHSIHQGKEIFLSWRFGEKKIEFYHEVESGFADRKPLKNLQKKKQQS